MWRCEAPVSMPALRRHAGLGALVLATSAVVLVVADAAAFDAVAGRSFYTDESEGRLVLHGLPDSLAGRQVRADVIVAGRVLATDAPVVFGRRPWVTFSLSGVPEGEGQVLCRLRVDGRDAGSAGTDLVRLAPKANAVKIDRVGGGLVVDGLPFFPFGFYCYWPVQPTLAEEEVVRGFGVMSPYQGNDPETIGARRAYMDRAAQLGMKVHYQLLQAAGGGGVSGGAMQDTAPADRDAWLRAEVGAFRDHPALLAWYIADEPTGHGVAPEPLERAYRIVRELDPYHPVTIAFDDPAAAARFAGAMDVALTDPYPIPNRPPGAVADAVRTVGDAVAPRLPVWLVPQAFGGNEWWTREPTASELRLMTWLGIVEGATGVQYFVRHGLSGFPKSPIAWSAASRAALEVAALTPYLLSDEAGPAAVTGDAALHAAAWRRRGEIVIAVLNTENRPRDVEVQLPGVDVAGAEAEVLYEDRSVPVGRLSRLGPVSLLFRPVGLVTGLLRPGADSRPAGVALHDVIDAYGVRLYRLPQVPPPVDAGVHAGNVIVDPSFEWDVAPATPPAVYADVGAGRGATVAVDGRIARHGRRCLRLTTPRAGEGVRVRPYAPVVAPGRSYRLSVWARARMAPRPPSLRLQSVAGDCADFELAPDWRQYRIDGVAGEGVTRGWVSLALATAGTAWIDLVELYDISPRIDAVASERGHLISVTSAVDDAEVRLRLDGGEVTVADPLYAGPVAVTGSRGVRAALFRGGQRLSSAALDLHTHAALGRFVDLADPYSPRYPAAGPGALTDGVLGTAQFDDGRWQGFEGVDLEAVIDLGASVPVRAVACRFLQNPASWIWLPRAMEVDLSDDGRRFRPFATTGGEVAATTQGQVVRELSAAAPTDRARYVRVRARTVGVCPPWHPGAGGPAWLFADEIRVNPEPLP